MLKNLLFITFAFLLIALGVGVYFVQKKDLVIPPSFSNYSAVDQKLYDIAERGQYYPYVPYEYISHYPSYPYEELESELERLQQLAKNRTSEEQSQFELEYPDIMWIEVGDGKYLFDYIGQAPKALTNEIYYILIRDLETIIAQEKIKHNIARPMHMDLGVNSPIPTPTTPAYPSLHAARIALADSVLKLFLTGEEYMYVSSRLSEAIERSHLFGVSTKFDTDYGQGIARAYFESMYNSTNTKEFVQVVREKEWPNDSGWPPKIERGVKLPDLIVLDEFVEFDGKNLKFKTNIENQGIASTPAEFKIWLEIDEFADGSIDKQIEIPQGQFLAGIQRETGYYINLSTPGTHEFRFVLNPDFSFLEELHHNNYGSWIQFTIE